MAKGAQQHTPPRIGSTHIARKHRAKVDARRGSARERGYDARWEKFSKDFLARNPLCEYCSTSKRTVPATVTDHDLPHGGDPALFWDNTFTALCTPCHNGTKRRLERRHSGDDLLLAIADTKAKARRV